MKVFHKAYYEFKEKGLGRPQASEYIGMAIKLIAENLVKLPSFSRYPFKEDMIWEGIECCIRYMHNFDPEKYSNPHAYFTTIIKYAFIRVIKKEKKELYGKYVLIAHHNTGKNTGTEGGDIEYGEGAEDNMHEFMRKYEESEEKKKEKKKNGTTGTSKGLDNSNEGQEDIDIPEEELSG